jgi:endonuclease/exonuclease/phosphatase family metal-dependent hydrolase
MIYMRKHDRENPHRLLRLNVVAQPELAAHPCLLIVDVHIGTEKWRIINFYNNTEDPSAMRALQALQLGDEVPTLLVGDFNTHSRTWSPLGWAPSTGAPALETWAATNTFELLTIPGSPTQRGSLHRTNRIVPWTWSGATSLPLSGEPSKAPSSTGLGP